MGRFEIVFLWLCLLSGWPRWVIMSAPSGEWQVHSFVEDAALANRNILSIAFESSTKVWLGSSDGLFSFDGYEWQTYSREDGLPSDLVRAVCVTRKGELWVGTELGFGLFNGLSFREVSPGVPVDDLSAESIVEDNDGSLWISLNRYPHGDSGGALLHYSGEEGRIYTDSPEYPQDYPVSVFRSLNGTLLSLGKDRVLRNDGGRWVHFLKGSSESQLPEFFVSDAESGDGQILLSSYEHTYIRGRETLGNLIFDSRRARHFVHVPDDAWYAVRQSSERNLLQFERWEGTNYVTLSTFFTDWNPVALIQHRRVEANLTLPAG